MLSDGSQPVGRGIGPALEARDVLAVLQRSKDAPEDLKQRACALAGALLELGGRATPGEGARLAAATIDDGRAWSKFQRICEAQGGMRKPPIAAQQNLLAAPYAGRVARIDNRRTARLAKLAGAPDSKAAGLDLHVKLGDVVEAGQPLCTLHAASRGELNYALDYATANPDIVGIETE
jgi:thymidine phosphorylase